MTGLIFSETYFTIVLVTGQHPRKNKKVKISQKSWKPQHSKRLNLEIETGKILPYLKEALSADSSFQRCSEDWNIVIIVLCLWVIGSCVCVDDVTHSFFLPILVYVSTERMFVKLTYLDSSPSNFEKSSTPKKYDKKEQIFLGFDRQRNQLVKCILKTI